MRRARPDGDAPARDSWDEPDWADRALPICLLRAREAVMAIMRPVLRAHGITEQQWRVLRVLSPARAMDKTTLARRAVLLMPSLLRILKDLERMGHLRLVATPGNARLRQVLLTPRGAGLVDVASRDLARKVQAVTAAIGEENLGQLLRLLHMVEHRVTVMAQDG